MRQIPGDFNQQIFIHETGNSPYPEILILKPVHLGC